MEELFNLVNGIPYTRDVPKEAEALAKEKGCVIIVGGSDDLMYCYGADSYMTDYVEHGYGWDGEDFSDIDDEQLKPEVDQLGLEIYWCGKIKGTDKKIEGYDTEKSGAFSYKVKEGIESKDFNVYEDEKEEEVCCTGIIIKLPDDFKSAK